MSSAAAEHTTSLAIEGMTCAACSARVGKALSRVPGVARAQVNLATGRAEVLGRARLEDLLAAVAEAGYSARPWVSAEERSARERAEAARLRRDALVALGLASPLLLVEMGGHLLPALHHWVGQTLGHGLSRVIQAVLAAAILFGPGARFFRLGLAALRARAPDMNSLVALGSGAAFAYSAAVLVLDAAAAVYFESAGVIVALVLLGRWLEARARGRAGEAIRALTALTPRSARRLRPDGSLEEVPVAALAPGDRLLIRPGERLPVDGVVEEGHSWLDQSMFTGEPLPVPRGPGEEVLGGSVNRDGVLLIRALRVGEETRLAGIIRMVEQAEEARLPIQALIDRITAVFVPVVMALAALTFLVWLGAGAGVGAALTHAVAVLIIACPCAMGLATPISIMVGMGRAARLGILFREGEALQRLAAVRLVAFDKTGTLTEGRPALSAVLPRPGFEAELLLRLAAAVEAQSEHPIARAILAAHPAPPAAENVRIIVGQGVAARVEGREVLVGSARCLGAAGIDPTPLQEVAEERAAQGETAVLIALDGVPAGVLTVADPLRPTAPAAIAALRALGLGLRMLTGDRAATARAIAARLGIDDVQAGLLPEDKLAALRGQKGVAFVGDGINDAPALAAADVGIAMGSGTDIAIEAAAVVLMRQDLGAVASAVRIARATLANIRQNLAWAFGYNVVLIPVAAGVLAPWGGPSLSPVLAAAAMGLSSLCVVGNALRLSWLRA
ncbi:MAG: heavy metal translocating P-type ATPase [Rhodovarius sp.]|nr:heavy metal translocating P-type ATPase [Rhodovarius sp.]